MFLLSPATVTITASTISGNMAVSSGGGGAILNSGTTLTITNSTIVGNTVTSGSDGGGGLRNQSGTSTITSSTIDSNTAPVLNGGETTTGGGILNSSGTVTLKNTIIANNTSDNCIGTIGNSGTNLQFPGTTCGAGITTGNPLLQALANNGGPTQTQSLGSGSPAIDQGTTGCPPVPATDQRAVTRPQGAGCEIGAFECRTSLGECVAGQVTNTPTNTPTSTPTSTPAGVATATPTNTPTTVAATPTRTTTPIAGVVVPTLTFPMLALLGLALAGAALLLLKR